jgi:CrcB protein
MLARILFIAAGGGIGALARYGLSGLVHRVIEASYPLGTFVVNVAGCFLFGFVWTIFEDRLLLSGDMRTAILVGFMGSFTTFSTFIFESNQLMRESQFLLAGLNIAGQVIIGFVALYAGMLLARML